MGEDACKLKEIILFDFRLSTTDPILQNGKLNIYPRRRKDDNILFERIASSLNPIH